MRFLRNTFINKVNRELGNDGSKYCQYTGVNYMFEWCMAFTSYVMREIVELGTKFPMHTSCTQFLNSAFALRRRNKDFKTAEIGDIILFELDYDVTDMEHVGIVVDVGADFIKLIEGNTSGDNCRETSVNTFTYKKDNPTFGWIIDMSEFFCDADSSQLDSDKLQKKKELAAEMLSAIGCKTEELNCLSTELLKMNDELSKIIEEDFIPFK